MTGSWCGGSCHSGSVPAPGGIFPGVLGDITTLRRHKCYDGYRPELYPLFGRSRVTSHLRLPNAEMKSGPPRPFRFALSVLRYADSARFLRHHASKPPIKAGQARKSESGLFVTNENCSKQIEIEAFRFSKRFIVNLFRGRSTIYQLQSAVAVACVDR